MSERRDLNMIEAILTVIGEMGDMPIPISSLWLERLIRRAGRPIEIYWAEDREVDACALETLCVLARANCIERKYEAVAPAIDWTPGRDVEGAYRVGHSQPPHPADGMTATVCIGDGAFSTILNPASFNNGSLGWTLTYGNAQAVRLTARSVIESYDYLLSGATTMKDATRRLRLLRNARRDLNRRACQEGAA
jgi:hypothetical protein